MGFDVIYQMVIQCHPGEYHLFERRDVWTVPPAAGMLLVNCGGPAVHGDNAGFDNTVVRVLYDGKRKCALLQLASFIDASRTLSEMREAFLAGWIYVRKLADAASVAKARQAEEANDENDEDDEGDEGDVEEDES